MNRNTPKVGSVAAAVVTLLVAFAPLASCGGGGGFGLGQGSSLSPEDQALADAIAKDTEASGEGFFNATESQCFGDGLVRGFGADRLNELGVTVVTPGGIDSMGRLDLTDSEATKTIDILDSCVDIKAILNEVLAMQLNEDAATCMTGKMSNDQIKDLLAATMITETVPPDQEALLRRLGEECGVG